MAGFIVGLLGSFHCIGMCGPLALALPSSQKNHIRIIGDRLIYNFGRVITYAILGLIIGIFGNRLFMFSSQRIVTIVLGSLIILSVFISLRYKNAILNSSAIFRFHQFIKSKLKILLAAHSSISMLFIGILNGFLPCGFVYMTLAASAAVSESGFINSMFFMIFFGFGTIPALLIVSFAGNFISLNIRRNLTKSVPVFIVILAVIFILRGLNLGIPYISPSLKSNNISEQTEPVCH